LPDCVIPPPLESKGTQEPGQVRGDGKAQECRGEGTAMRPIGLALSRLRTTSRVRRKVAWLEVRTLQKRVRRRGKSLPVPRGDYGFLTTISDSSKS
jgi:hypothetical protein